jgi:hypothetical protein
VLGDLLPEALARGADCRALAPYERALAPAFARYARTTHALLMLSRHPPLRRYAMWVLRAHPALFRRLVAWAVAPTAARGGRPLGSVGELAQDEA